VSPYALEVGRESSSADLLQLPVNALSRTVLAARIHAPRRPFLFIGSRVTSSPLLSLAKARAGHIDSLPYLESPIGGMDALYSPL